MDCVYISHCNKHHYIPSSSGQDMDDTDVEQWAKTTWLNTFPIPLFQALKLRDQHEWKYSRSNCLFPDTGKGMENRKNCSQRAFFPSVSPLGYVWWNGGFRAWRVAVYMVRTLGPCGSHLFKWEEGPPWGVCPRDISPGVIMEFGFGLFLLEPS